MEEPKEGITAENGLGRLSARGPYTLAVILALALAIGGSRILSEHDAHAATAEQVGALKLAVERLATMQDQQIRLTAEMVYVTTLPEAEKKKINLLMPESLRQRLVIHER
jgi:hypothetical protein